MNQTDPENDPAQKIHDITKTLSEDQPSYPGDPPMVIDKVSDLDLGDSYTLSAISMSLHQGTHVDAPSHFITGAKTIDQLSIHEFLMPARMVSVDDILDEHDAYSRVTVTTAHVEGLEILKGYGVLFKTNGGYISSDAAKLLVRRGVRLVGIDSESVDPIDDTNCAVHRILLGNGIIILENIDLSSVTEGVYTLFCPPLKIKGCEASPVRAMLFPLEAFLWR